MKNGIVGIPNREPIRGWDRPERTLQLNLFSDDPEEFLAANHISMDEAIRWYQAGWLSFDPALLQEFNNIHTTEIIFVQNIVRSGLSNAFISRLLQELESPYNYNHHDTAYHFRYGWVCLPDNTMKNLDFLESVQTWADNCLEDGGNVVLDRICAKVLAYQKSKENQTS